MQNTARATEVFDSNVLKTNDLKAIDAEIINTYNQAIESGKDESSAWGATRTMLKEQYQRQVYGDKEHRLACQGPEKAGFLFGLNFHLISPFFDLIALTEYDLDVSRIVGRDLDLLS